MLFGAHVPTTGGLPSAPARGRQIEAAAIQVFTRSQLQWRARPPTAGEASAFREAMAESGIEAVLSHGSYLVNLASPDPVVLQKSRDTFLQEMERCHAFGIPCLVFHPGAHMGLGVERGIDLVAESLSGILEAARGLDVMPLVEVTAGQGSCLGHTFEEVAAILRLTAGGERLGVCLDTCHLYAAGYDIATAKGYERTMRRLDAAVGLGRVKALHLNDARLPLGSRRDRHERPGRGTLGLATFRRIANDPRLFGIPAVLETSGPIENWRADVAELKALVRPAGRRKASGGR